MSGIVGILLAAGKGVRFDPAGVHNKLLQPLASGEPVVARAARNLLDAIPTAIAVVRPEAPELASALNALGCVVTVCPHADDGMAASLVHALRLSAQAQGWIIALGDMPYVQSATIAVLCGAIAAEADIAVPVQDGRRGNPVAFGRRHLPRLLQLTGDQGARALLQEFPVTELAVDDPGIFADIDTPADLQ